MSHILESNKRLVNLVKEIFFSGYQAMLVSGETVVDQETKNALNDKVTKMSVPSGQETLISTRPQGWLLRKVTYSDQNLPALKFNSVVWLVFLPYAKLAICVKCFDY